MTKNLEIGGVREFKSGLEVNRGSRPTTSPLSILPFTSHSADIRL